MTASGTGHPTLTNCAGPRRNRWTARRRPGTLTGHLGGGHRRQRARDERSLPRSSRSSSAGAHAGIALPVPLILAAAPPVWITVLVALRRSW